jgi:hypothetical protein
MKNLTGPRDQSLRGANSVLDLTGNTDLKLNKVQSMEKPVCAAYK